jgi:hypothetical protein
MICRLKVVKKGELNEEIVPKQQISLTFHRYNREFRNAILQANNAV